MKKTTKQIILTVLLISFANIAAFCQNGKADCDKSIKSKLDALEIKYEITENGNFRIIHKLKNGRTQLVIIDSETEMFNDKKLRHIYSFALGFKKDTDLTLSNLFVILQQNADKKIGAWQIGGKDDNYSLIFSLSIGNENAIDNLEDLIHSVAFTTDTLEEKLTGDKDDY